MTLRQCRNGCIIIIMIISINANERFTHNDAWWILIFRSMNWHNACLCRSWNRSSHGKHREYLVASEMDPPSHQFSTRRQTAAYAYVKTRTPTPVCGHCCLWLENPYSQSSHCVTLISVHGIGRWSDISSHIRQLTSNCCGLLPLYLRTCKSLLTTLFSIQSTTTARYNQFLVCLTHARHQ